ncbi:flagellar assembly protein FliX [Ferrovibrio sp.]|uniref:flagellar assembly protein FliX n=1 Tax=Ferrovibrio sp. TaxID=1917215 RepID=UPI001B6E4F8D|nr:flagellar assembly protein FliX [Ferrovibrio sp.]MBP7066176.1 flagellar assembly protein FliX [Ferrovibrio sp.]
MSINKISGPGSLAPGAAKRTGGAGAAGGASFASLLKGSSETSTGGVTGAAPMAGLDAMLTLQAVDGDAQKQERRRAFRRGTGLLDKLEDIQEGLLEGRIPVDRLQGLAQALRQERMMVADPQLAELIGEIELRCEVELAKLGY